MINIIQFLNSLTIDIFEIYLVIRTLDFFFNKNKYNNKIIIFAATIKLVTSISVDYLTPKAIINFIVSFLLVLILVLCYKGKIIRKIIAAITINFAFAISELIVAVLVGVNNLDILAEASNNERISLFFSRVIYWFIMICIQNIKCNNKLVYQCRIFLLEIFIFISICGELLFLSSIKGKNAGAEMTIILTAELAIFVTIILQDSIESLFQTNRQAGILEKEKEYYKKEAVLMQKNQELERQFRHDWNNRLQIINEIVKKNDSYELKMYLSQISERVNDLVAYSKTNNIIIDSIINCKLQEAVDRGVEIDVSIVIPQRISIEDDDMVVILGNLLDNAIEACDYIDTDKYINLSIKYDLGTVFICVRNSFDGIVGVKGGEIKTRKKDEIYHGIGINGIKKTVKKYNGTAEFAFNEREFIVNIIMYET